MGPAVRTNLPLTRAQLKRDVRLLWKRHCRALVFGLLVLILAVLPAASCASASGSTQELDAADQAMVDLRSWLDLHAWYERYYPKWDDGYIGEGLSVFVGDMFSLHWESLPTLLPLVEGDNGFRAFVVGHLGEVISCDATREVVRNTSSRCPSEAQTLCSEIREAISENASPACLK